jgi:hypothetical protein
MENKVFDTLNDIEKNIVLLAAVEPSVCENYNLLCAMYWHCFDNVSSLSGIDKATPAETITRAYRVLVNEGLVQQMPRTSRRRRELAAEFREALSPNNAKYIRC